MLSAFLAVVLLTPPGTPAGGFHWQRIITPPPGASTQQACVVLDAATFANAAPALRDLRLFQDGTELPYIIEESYDERALNSGVTSDDDRSEYEPVYMSQMQQRPAAGIPGTGDTRRDGDRDSGYFSHFVLEPHVPVERIRIESTPASIHFLSIVATPVSVRRSSASEVERHTLNADNSIWAFTLGANLQGPADVTLVDEAPGTRTERAIFEMRKRSLCYQPRSTNPLVLYLGGGQGISAKVYGLSNGFSTDQKRPYATMGPLEPNPDLEHPRRHPISRLLVAIAVLSATLLLTLWVGLELIRKEKGRPKATL